MTDIGTPLINKAPSIGLTDFLGAVGSIAGAAINYDAQMKTNKANREINQQNIDYNTAMTQAQWERDDNAHQREVADLKAAGLSPLAATNGANNSAAIGAPNPIAMQAPQIDINSIINAALENKALNENKRHNMVQEGYEGIELSQKAEELEQQWKELDIKDKELNHKVLYDFKYLQNMSAQLSEAKRHNLKDEELRKLSYMSEAYMREIRQQAGNNPYKVYKDINEYETALTKWADDYQVFITTFISDTSGSHSESTSSAWNGSAGGGTPLLNGQGSLGESESNSGSTSFNVSQKQAAELDKWLKSHPMPVYIYFRFD